MATAHPPPANQFSGLENTYHWLFILVLSYYTNFIKGKSSIFGNSLRKFIHKCTKEKLTSKPFIIPPSPRCTHCRPGHERMEFLKTVLFARLEAWPVGVIDMVYMWDKQMCLILMNRLPILNISLNRSNNNTCTHIIWYQACHAGRWHADWQGDKETESWKECTLSHCQEAANGGGPIFWPTLQPLVCNFPQGLWMKKMQ